MTEFDAVQARICMIQAGFLRLTQDKSLKTTNIFYKVNPPDIFFIRYVFEALDGIAVITTLPSDKQVIVIRTAPGCEEDVLEVVESLSNTVTMEPTYVEWEDDL